MPQAKHSYMDCLSNSKSPDTSFFFKPVTSHEVKLEILSIPNNKSHGLYSCPTKLLKCSCDIMSPVLANFLNKSVSLGEYPSKLKMSKIIPIYRADDETDACNYRPISLLSNFNRIFEKIMYNRMKVFIEKHHHVDHKIFFDKFNYYGFRGIVNQWFSSYLTSRTQTTEINSYISDKEVVNCGVHQRVRFRAAPFFVIR